MAHWRGRTKGPKLTIRSEYNSLCICCRIVKIGRLVELVGVYDISARGDFGAYGGYKKGGPGSALTQKFDGVAKT